MKKITSIFICLVYSALGHGQTCIDDGTPYYQYTDIVAILDQNECNSCHSSSGESPEWTYETYSNLLTVGECDIPIVVHGDASQSLLYDKLNGGTSSCGLPMPLQRLPLKQDEVFAIESWINNGATKECIPFYDDVVVALSKYSCNSCHDFNNTWSYLSYEHMTGKTGTSLCDDIVIPFSSVSSVLMEVINGEESSCTSIPNHEKISSGDISLITDWINGGALEGAFALPVTLTDFTIELEGRENLVNVHWSTEQEIGTDRYILERNIEASGFKPIAEIAAAGSSTESKSYKYIDVDGFIGTAYYRLKILDLDGSYSYSNILSIRVEPNDDILSVYPNVLMGGEMLNIVWHSKVERPFTYASIVDPVGREVKQVNLTEGENLITIPKLSNGIYYVIIQDYFDSYQIKRFIVVD